MDGTMIALDVGTTQIKAARFDSDGNVVEMEKCATPLRYIGERESYCPDEIWKIVESQLNRLLRRNTENNIGISITGMAEAGVVINRKSGKAMTDILPWFAHCTCELAQQLSEEESDRIFQVTGLRNSFKYGIYKFLWFLEEKNLKKKEAVWLSVCDYIAFRMTGEMVTDPTFAARTYVYNVREMRWDTERIYAHGLQADNFPKVKESGSVIGYYQGIPVAIAGHDHICAAFGLLYGKTRGICDSAGTSETYIGILDEIWNKGFPKQSGLLYGPFVDGGYFFMGNVPSSGHSVEWFRKRLQMEEMTYENMNERLQALESGPSGLLYFPYLTGMGAPWYQSEMSGAMIGLKESNDGAQVLKGILEGIQFQAKWLLRLVEEFHALPTETIVCAGGSVKNYTMMQLKADILNSNVCIPTVTEATLCGAAALYLKKNYGKDAADQFLKQAVRISKEYRVNMKNAECYERIFKEQYIPFVNIIKKQLK